MMAVAATLFGLSGLLSGTAAGGPLYNVPVYEPETGNYFELRKVEPGYSSRGRGVPAIGWNKARTLARKSTYRGAKGRLAVVKRRTVNDFLRRTFEPVTGAWIGLRYWCELNKLQWVTGEIHELSGYANWGSVWRHDGASLDGGPKVPTCGRKTPFWPVHYWSVDKGFRWNANGNRKEMRAFFIEYPTGER